MLFNIIQDKQKEKKNPEDVVTIKMFWFIEDVLDMSFCYASISS